MQNNYHFLSQLTRALDPQLRSAPLSECYTQEKAELMIRFETANGSFHLRANLSASFTCLSFPKDFQRARKNSVDLFSLLIGRRVLNIIQHTFDRSFTMVFSDGFSLAFKLHGNRSNIILFEGEEVIDLFRGNIGSDRQLRLAELNRNIDLSYDAFVLNQHRLPSLYFTFGKIPWLYLNAHGFAELDVPARWRQIQALLSLLDTPRYYQTRIDGALVFSLLPIGQIEKQFTDPVSAVTTFAQTYRSREGFETEQAQISSLLRKRFIQAGDALERASVRLTSLKTHDKWKEWADLLMANLHLTPEGDRIVVPNFYSDYKPEEIRVRPDLSLQKNAAVYYSKSKKQQIEVKHLEEQILQRREELATLQKDLDQLNVIEDIRTLRLFVARQPKNKVTDQTETLPYHETSVMGYRILIGRNAQANDDLLQRFGYKDDLWLHAKDVPGSHVLIKFQAGKAIPKTVIERAAQLAAWYSKRKTDTLCPVSVTPRKYVRKRKGDPAGAVQVEKESVVMVEPRGPDT